MKVPIGRANIVSALCLGVLPRNKECLEQGNSRFNIEHIIENNEQAKDVEGIRCKLGQNDSKKIKDIDDEMVKRKSKVSTKEFLINS